MAEGLLVLRHDQRFRAPPVLVADVRQGDRGPGVMREGACSIQEAVAPRVVEATHLAVARVAGEQRWHLQELEEVLLGIMVEAPEDFQPGAADAASMALVLALKA
eukprot:CAMPEP_0197903696 /NCGR_PEP_ID=MMETSP1439-20131203/56572_1 /TAXON_ID=66791 /ORGANISM="Gonyaulax spinifera, Strain CCMP409" /LENGTH=104 /DNA_ID=CAMNT_0043524839 /DNA_START=174 /DNA_END=486 /DNA_ORIENTATION=+